jgi:hypothetical protein
MRRDIFELEMAAPPQLDHTHKLELAYDRFSGSCGDTVTRLLYGRLWYMSDYYARNSAHTSSIAIRWLEQSPRNPDGRLAGPNLLTISYGDPVESRDASRRAAHGTRSLHRRACVQRLSGARRMAAGTGLSHFLALPRPSMPLARSFAGEGAGEGSPSRRHAIATVSRELLLNQSNQSPKPRTQLKPSPAHLNPSSAHLNPSSAHLNPNSAHLKPSQTQLNPLSRSSHRT